MTLLARLGKQLPERNYLGIDVGYKEHVAVVIPLQSFAQDGSRWKRTPCFHFPSTRSGLDKLQEYLDGFSVDRETFFGICEPTGGFYGASMFQYLLDKGYPMWLIENALTRHMREKIMGHIPKTDEIDARVMARVGYLHEAVGEEFTLRPLILAESEDADLLALCRDSWRLKTMISRARNQLSQLMAVVFPELKTFFTRSVSSIAPVSLIAAYPTPAELAAASAEEVRSVLWQAGAYHHAKRVHELQAMAHSSSGLLPDPQRAWRLGWVTGFLLANFKAQAALEKQVETLVTEREDYQWIVDVPYSGPATLGLILGATGDIHRFQNYRQFVAYTGYFAGLETSQTIDRTRMSRRGNRDLKRALFQIAAPLVWFDRGENPYKALFERKEAEGRPWYRAMPYVCAALARHIYHCLKYQDTYDAKTAFGAPLSSHACEDAVEDLRAGFEDRLEVMEAHLSQEEV
jgi:transposase